MLLNHARIRTLFVCALVRNGSMFELVCSCARKRLKAYIYRASREWLLSFNFYLVTLIQKFSNKRTRRLYENQFANITAYWKGSLIDSTNRLILSFIFFSLLWSDCWIRAKASYTFHRKQSKQEYIDDTYTAWLWTRVHSFDLNKAHQRNQITIYWKEKTLKLDKLNIILIFIHQLVTYLSFVSLLYEINNNDKFSILIQCPVFNIQCFDNIILLFDNVTKIVV